MGKSRLGPKQKRILNLLIVYPNSTITQIAELMYGKPILRRSKQYNSTCRSFHLLETQGLLERAGGQATWHVKPKNP